ISGAISNDPDYIKKFKAAEEKIRGKLMYPHIKIFNPATDPHCIALKDTIKHEVVMWTVCMKVCIYNMLNSDVAYFLPDWKFGRGAQIEHDLCEKLTSKSVYL